MSNIVDYIAWRGDLSFDVQAFNHIDSLILCQLLYAYLDDIVPQDFSHSVTVAEAEKCYTERRRNTINLGLLINKQTAEFFSSVAKSERFSCIKLCGFVNEIDEGTEKQFAAMCAVLPDNTLCVIYRGTDDTIVGWKEDFNMTFLAPVPAQSHAVEYIEKAAKKLKGKLFVMGHSKGGNLATYAALQSSPKIRQRIVEVFNNDGPGFSQDVATAMDDKETTKKIRAVMPDASVVGALLHHPYDFTIVESSERFGIAQHDLFSWQLLGNQFIQAPKRTKTCLATDKAVKTWIADVEEIRRKEFVESLFNVLQATGAKTLLQLTDDWLKSPVAVVKAMREIDKGTREQIFAIVKLFFQSYHINIASFKDLF